MKKTILKTLPLFMGLALAGNMVAAPASSVNDNVAIQQQARTVSGSVVDATTGEPIIGANVLEVGTTNGTITDFDGKFSLQVKSGAKLQISYIGYVTQTVTVTSTDIKVSLKEDSESLEEVIVVGYGAVRKADLAGAVSAIDNRSFKDQPMVNAGEALQGRMSGVYVENSGVPGASMKIRVRGSNSVNKSNDPLYVVDGVVRESGLDGINPDDIKSMQVLKDASSTAIYGARGANGVVLVQTKTGIAGRTDITFNMNMGISSLPKKLETLNAKEYADVLVKQGADANALSAYTSGKDAGIDWQDAIFRTGITQDYRVAISSGSDKTQYRVSGNFTDRTGILENTSYKRYQAKANVTSKVTDWLQMTADMSAAHTIQSGNGAGMSGDNPIFVALNYAPAMTMMKEDGTYNKDPYGSIQNNPLGTLNNQNDRIANMFNGLIEFKFNIAKGLTFTTTNGVDYKDYKTYGFTSTKVNTTNSMSNADTSRMMLQSSNNLTYMGNWGDHHLTATGVWEATSEETRYMSISGSGLQSESVGYWNYNLASTRNGSNSYTKWTMLSGVGRVMYNFADRYLLTGTLRADGSSRFSKKKWGYFPSIAAAWTLSNESFMQDFTALQNIKIRASYGVVGNQAIDPYSTLGMLSSTSFNFGTSNSYTGYWEKNVATPDLTWEKTKQFDFGVDFNAWNGRISASIDVFSKRTTDALLSYQAANYIGGTTYWVNQGEISNKGIDLSLTANIISTNTTSYTTTLTGTYMKNRVEKLAGGDNDYFFGAKPASGMCDEATIIMPGEAIGSFWGYEWAGINSNGQDTYKKADGTVTTAPEGEDRKIIGKATPDFTLGWNNTVTYKNWEFNAFFNASFGAQRLNLTRYAMASMPGNARAITLKEAVTQAGTNYPAIGVKDNTYLPVSTKWVENADYLRLDNLSVSYNLGKDVTKFADIRLTFSAQNLFVLTGYKGYDPTGSTVSDANADVNGGIDVGSYPNPRTFTFGVTMNF